MKFFKIYISFLYSDFKEIQTYLIFMNLEAASMNVISESHYSMN